MKNILIILIALLPVTIKAQDWKESYTTKKGITISAKDSIKIACCESLKVLKHIKPSPEYDGPSYSVYLRHLGSFMLGNTYPIAKLSRIRISKKPEEYKFIIVITDPYADPFTNDIEYLVDIDDALDTKVIELKRAQ